MLWVCVRRWRKTLFVISLWNRLDSAYACSRGQKKTFLLFILDHFSDGRKIVHPARRHAASRPATSCADNVVLHCSIPNLTPLRVWGINPGDGGDWFIYFCTFIFVFTYFVANSSKYSGKFCDSFWIDSWRETFGHNSQRSKILENLWCLLIRLALQIMFGKYYEN